MKITKGIKVICGKCNNYSFLYDDIHRKKNNIIYGKCPFCGYSIGTVLDPKKTFNYSIGNLKYSNIYEEIQYPQFNFEKEVV